jgi:hypothetical protein
MMGSDLGHWDVPSFTMPLVEAYELVEDGILTDEQFKEFTCTNAVRFYAGAGRSFFAGTSVQAAVARIQADLAGELTPAGTADGSAVTGPIAGP